MSTASFMTGVWTVILVIAFGLAVYELEQPFIVLSAVLGAVTTFLIGFVKGVDS